MSIQESIEKMKTIQANILDFLTDIKRKEEIFNNLSSLLNVFKIKNDILCIKSLLRLILNIANNHHRVPDFFGKIEKILGLFKNEIKNNFSNSEIFKMFKSNKRILLYLMEEKIMIMDQYIAFKMLSPKLCKYKYPEYFSPEIKPFIDDKFIQKCLQKYPNSQINFLLKKIRKEQPGGFNDVRKIGENESAICKIIREDKLSKFIYYISENKLPLKSYIELSYFETNSFLLKKDKVSLIEYAAFFGSFQIFQYLSKNDVELSSSLANFAVHGKNMNVIQLLEKSQIVKDSDFYSSFFEESIKCHHNEIANYIQNKYLHKKDDDKHFESCILCLKYCNFAFIQNDSIGNYTFYYLCKYDYYSFVNTLLKEKSIDVNKIVI